MTSSHEEPKATSPVQSAEGEAFMSHARIVSLLTFVSRLAGLMRDAVCSRVFGAGPAWTAFAFAFLMPNLFRRLFGEGALSAAFLPEYARLKTSDPVTARRFATRVLGKAAAVLWSIVIVVEVLLWIASSSSLVAASPDRMLVVRLLQIMMPFMPLICLVALLGAILQVNGRFGPTAAAPILLNICIVSAAGWFSLRMTGADPAKGVILVGVGVLIAGILQFAWSWFALPKGTLTSYGKSRHDNEARAGTARMLKVMIPMVLGLGILQVNSFLDNLIAAWPVTFGSTIAGIDYPLDTASGSIVFFSQRLYQFPLGVFGVALATAIFPALSRSAAADDDGASFMLNVRHGIRLAMFIGLPATVGLILVRTPLTTVVFQGGAFSAADVPRVASVLTGYASAVWAYSITHILTRAYYAQNDSITPVRIAIGVMFLNITLNLILIWPLGEQGLAWSTATAAICQCLLLLRGLNTYVAGVVDRSVLRGWGQTALGTIVMLVVVSGLGFAMKNLPSTWTMALVKTLAMAVTGTAAFTGFALITRQDEVRWLARR